MDVRSLFAAQSYRSQKSALVPEAEQATPGTSAGRAVDDFAQTLRESEKLAEASLLDQADPHMLVNALSQSELAVETVVAVRNKVVEAYQEILRMPV